MMKTQLTALTLAGLMAVASGAAFAESTTTPANPVNKSATKLPGTDTAPTDRNSSNTQGTQSTQGKPGIQGGTNQQPMDHSTTHDKNGHGDAHKSGNMTEKTKTN